MIGLKIALCICWGIVVICRVAVRLIERKKN